MTNSASNQRSKYGVAKRLMSMVTGSREALAGLYMRLPTAISAPIYDAARSVVFRDNRHRMAVFEVAFGNVARSENVGDYLEFGVARGTSMISAMKTARNYRAFESMRFHAFDSFEGLPGSEGDFTKGDMSYGEQVFTRFLLKAGVPLERVTINKGFFDQALEPHIAAKLGINPGRAHVVHIDCDLYLSTVPVLRFLAPLLGVGSVIIFDDWFSFESEPCPWNHGEQRAFREWKERARFEPLAITYPWNAAWKLVR
ncbi:TylF/MycF/NovP-related O-methyltransferase [Tsuneonella sp. HG249]